MEFNLHRATQNPKNTIGKLAIADTLFQCHTLEDLERKVKIPKQTAIPCGHYRMRLSHSPRFNRVTLELLNVPNFGNIRVHSGNDEDDTEGCIIVGWAKNEDKLSRSRPCEAAITAIAEQADVRGEELWMNITSDFEPSDAAFSLS
jgi:Family of unknown function (DUF5675)